MHVSGKAVAHQKHGYLQLCSDFRPVKWGYRNRS